MKVVEVKGVPQVFTQTDGKTFRVYARQTKVIADRLISNEFRVAEKSGNILLLPDDVPIKNKKK